MIGPACRGAAFSAGVFALGTALIATVAMLLIWPATRQEMPRASGSVAAEPLRQALQPQALASLQRDVAACGRRVPGSIGLDRAADLIVATARAAGAEVIEMPVRSPRAVTTVATLAAADGAVPAGPVIYPFKPNLLQPGITPAEGLGAKLLLVDDAWERTGSNGDGAIALIDAAKPPANLGMGWAGYAARGFSGLVITHGDGLAALDWTVACSQAEATTPINFPRVAATPAVLALAGTQVRLTVQISWQTVEHLSLIHI
jgi:hypothetical protein